MFSSRGIAIEILPLLTDSQLLELGITDERERVKLMDTVKKLREVPSAALAHTGERVRAFCACAYLCAHCVCAFYVNVLLLKILNKPQT